MNKLYAENVEDNVFGEIAMLDPLLVKRTANVISIGRVTVLALTKVVDSIWRASIPVRSLSLSRALSRARALSLSLSLSEVVTTGFKEIVRLCVCVCVCE